MLYAVSTHSFLVVVEFDEDLKIIDSKMLNKGYHYGLAIDSKGYWTDDSGMGRYLIAYYGGRSVDEQDEPQLLVYRIDESIDFVKSVPLNGRFGDVHQISCANNGIYIVNSKYNNLVFIDAENETKHEFFFEDVSYDRNHINSVYPCGENILVMLHNKGRRESQMAILKHCKTNGFQMEKMVSLWHHACHNIFLDENYLLYNASPVHSLVKVDVQNGKIMQRLPFDGHSKGLSVTEKHIVVGLSENTFRDRRHLSKGRLAILDREDLSIKEIVDINFSILPHPIGNINEVRCLNENEFSLYSSDKWEINWSEIKFSENSKIRHFSRRIKYQTMLPIRTIKKIVRKYL